MFFNEYKRKYNTNINRMQYRIKYRPKPVLYELYIIRIAINKE